MKTPFDPELGALLRRADPADGAPPLSPERFAAQVRARIQAAEQAGSHGHGGWARQLLPLAAALAVMASLGAGALAAHHRQDRARTELFAAAYARSIDPWLMHAASERR